MNVIYIHGFNSGANSSTGDRLKEAFDCDVYTPEYKSECDVHTNLKSLKRQISLLPLDEGTIIIGTSLGGMYALELNTYYNLPTVLFNPAINTYNVLKAFLGKNSYFSTNVEYEFTEDVLESYKYFNTFDISNRKENILVYTGINDKLVNSFSVINFFGNYCKVNVVDEEHRISDFTPYAKSIKDIVNVING